MRIKELKGAYREHYNELQVVKSEVDYTQVRGGGMRRGDMTPAAAGLLPWRLLARTFTPAIEQESFTVSTGLLPAETRSLLMHKATPQTATQFGP